MIDNRTVDFLNKLPIGDKGKTGTLRYLAFMIGEKAYRVAKNGSKSQVIAILSEYYCAPGRFEQLWNSLSDAERKIVSLHVWAGGFEPLECADAVAEKFGIHKKPELSNYFYARNGLDKFKMQYAAKDSKLRLLIPQSSNDQPFSKELRSAVGEMKRVYSNVSKGIPFETRENRTADFTNIVRFCNSNKLTVTKSGILNKSSALKLRDFCGYEEYAADIKSAPEDMRTTQGLLVTFPLIVLCTTGGLLTITEGECIPGSKVTSLINLPHEQLVKHLFNAYLRSESFDEISIMKGLKAKRGHHPFTARQNIVQELIHCPLGQFVYTIEFEGYLRIVNRAFARKGEWYVVPTGNCGYGVEWEEYEHPLIGIILSFFGALGIMDIVWGKDRGAYAKSGRRVPIAFRINPLGAYVLDRSGTYTAPVEPKVKIKGGFTVLPDYTIVVPESLNRIKHELYFEKLFTKVSATEEASIYKLDFETVVRATDSGTSVADLRKYLSASDKPVPENIARALDDWEKQSGRIRLRQVTILECDDEALLEEVIHYKGMGEFVQEKLNAAVVVDGSTTHKIKKNIEKSKRFCKDVI